ncbi:MAG: hypothetical protein EXS31_07380 [Pedosphaera sp.]|nr:hypothetical protein [Pedosphaera sp.]
MKTLMLAGSLLGFAIGFGFSSVQNASSPQALWRGCLAACGATILMRWWGRLWLKSLREAYLQRQASEEAAAEANNATVSTK